MPVRSIRDIPQTDLSGRKVLVRACIEDETGFLNSLPTLAYLSRARARIVLATDGDFGQWRSRTQELLECEIHSLEYWRTERAIPAVARLAPGSIAVIENLNLESGEASADEVFAHDLARLCDVYCNEAFELSHEIRTSTVAVPQHAEAALAGLAFDRDLSFLEFLRDIAGEPSLSILGGVLSTEKLRLAEEVASRSDYLCLGGRLCYPFLIIRGSVSDRTAVTAEMLTIAARMLDDARQKKRFISIPEDFAVMEAGHFNRLVGGERFLRIPIRMVQETALQTNQIICDIGKITRWHWSDLFARFRRIFWHGPLGMSEFDAFAEGSRFLAFELAMHAWPERYHVLACGRSLMDGLLRTGFPMDRLHHMTASGRAALHHFAGRRLPAVEVLAEAARMKEHCRVLIPLTGSRSDLYTLLAAAKTVSRNAELYILHVRSGPDEEEHPDFAAALSEKERMERRLESEALFTWAATVLAYRGLVPAVTFFSQGHFAKVVRRTAARIGADLIVSYDEVDVAQAEARLIARPRRRGATSTPMELGLRKMLVAVDDSDASVRAVAHISEFVDAEESEISVLFSPEHAGDTASGFGRIDTALARQGLMARQHLTVETDPASDILKRAEETGTDLIVLQSRMGKGRILRKIASRAGCSVLAVGMRPNEYTY